jgi:hypothetical protein
VCHALRLRGRSPRTPRRYKEADILILFEVEPMLIMYLLYFIQERRTQKMYETDKTQRTQGGEHDKEN